MIETSCVNKTHAKLIAALLLMGVAVGIFLYNNRAEPIPDNDDTRTYWYDTKESKGFMLSGPESQDKVRTRRKKAADENNPLAFRGRDVTEQVALSPFTKEYTGVEAVKCPRCGEIFPLRNDKGEDNVCPKCKWNPLATEPEQSEKPQG